MSKPKSAKVFVCTSTNYWHNSSGYTTVVGVASSLKASKDLFDADHNHSELDCDWCSRAYKWKRDGDGGLTRTVDHDGATVVYNAQPFEVSP